MLIGFKVTKSLEPNCNQKFHKFTKKKNSGSLAGAEVKMQPLI